MLTLLPSSLGVLLSTCGIVVAQWQLSRAEVLLRVMDSGRQTELNEGTINSINMKAVIKYATLR